jgi:ubiquinone/menaquinone biosynthesis C-methylase UbiE
MEHESYDFSVGDVSEVYAGPGGKLWEMLMGEQIHVGGPEQTDVLAQKIKLGEIGDNTKLLDICCALGGPARHLAEKYGVSVVGLDITKEMLDEAQKRTEGKPYSSKIEYRLGSGLDVPAKSEEFDVVWGQDAWCYIRDKPRLIQEACRVLKSGGFLAFTDWIWGPTPVPKEESDFMMKFMVFPNLETLDGYRLLIQESGLQGIEHMDMNEDFAAHIDGYIKNLQATKEQVVEGFGEELYLQAEAGILAWQKAVHEKKVSRGLWIARKK